MFNSPTSLPPQNDVHSALYRGLVTHKRLQPVAHELKYEVTSLLIDVDALGTERAPSLLTYNRFGLFSIYDADHGLVPGQSIRDFAWDLVRSGGKGSEVNRIFMLCYPRMLGFGFNPLTVYYGLDAQGETRFLIYEVHNTFGGRHVYHTDVMAPGEAQFQKTQKLFRVSPFNGVDGEYGLRASAPVGSLSLGVALTTSEGPILKAYFKGERKALTNGSLLSLLGRMPFMTFKIVAGIHWEALKLWLKGLKLAKVTVAAAKRTSSTWGVSKNE